MDRTSQPLRWMLIAVSLLALLTIAGCWGDESTPPQSNSTDVKKSPLRVLLVDDASLSEVLEREWTARTDVPLAIEQVTSSELGSAKRLATDVVIFPTAMLGSLAEVNLIAELPSEEVDSAEHDARAQFASLRDEARWGGQAFGVSLGSPRLMLAYRADVLERLGAEPPQTWPELSQLIARMADPKMLEGLPIATENWQALVQPTADGDAGNLLLARVASGVLNSSDVSPLLDFDTLEPKLTEPPFVAGLAALVADCGASHQTTRYTTAECWEQLATGHAAMAITYPIGNAETPADAEATAIAATIRFAPLPADSEGSPATVGGFAGRVVSVARASSQPQVATQFVWWLTSGEILSRISPASGATYPATADQVAQIERWSGALSPTAKDSAAAALAKIHSDAKHLLPLRLPGYRAYAEALDAAVAKAIDEKTPAQESLEGAAAAWKQIHVKQGNEQQLRAHQRSLRQLGN